MERNLLGRLYGIFAGIGTALMVAAALAATGVPVWADGDPVEAADAVLADEPPPIDPLLAELIEEDAAQEVSDPFEGVNRRTLRFNQGLDRWVLTPMTRVYAFIVPSPARRAVLRVFDNLNAPAVTVNDLLQREWKDAGVTVARFALNTTVGLAGLFDPAKELGLPGHNSDFGQTLALYGTPSGPFLMLPFLGPTTARDGTGYIVDFFFRPTTWLFPLVDQLVYVSIHEGGLGFATLEAQSAGLHLLEESSIDFYAALRSAYVQKRTADIWVRREHHRTVTVARADGTSAPGAASPRQIADAADVTSGLPTPGR